MDFLNTRVFCAQKADNNTNFATDGIFSSMIVYNSIGRDKNKH
jgi:hypothetical protein